MDSGRPIPKPRRTLLEQNKYENVSINVNNQEVKVCVQDNDTDDNKNKNNDPLCDNTLGKPPHSDEVDYKKTVNDLNACTEGTPETSLSFSSSLASTMPPTPAPRVPRKSMRHDIYENVKNVNMSNFTEVDTNANFSVNKNDDNDECISYKNLNIPKQCTINKDDGSVSPVSTFSLPENWKLSAGGYVLKKSESNSTIDSSQSSISSGADSQQKYKSPPPSQLLKNLSSTSKLLTEAISERVSIKAKNAKHVLNENIKMSQDILHTLGTDTVSRLKNVRKKIHSPLKNYDRGSNVTKQYEHGQSTPSMMQDKIFNSISFNSPLDRNSETYEIPKNSKKLVNTMPGDISNRYSRNTDDADDYDDRCPTFEEAMKSRHSYSLKNFEISPTSEPVPRYKQKSEAEIDNANKMNRDSINLPMPNYPAPVLKQEQLKNYQDDQIYGKLRNIQPPARLKRKQRAEKIAAANEAVATTLDEASPPTSFGTSNRVTLDSLEFASMSIESPSSRESQGLTGDEEKFKDSPSRISNTSKSQSWEYYDQTGDDDAASPSSSPEPIYANQEATYDRLCEMGTTNESKIMLSPKSDVEKGQNASRAARTASIFEKDILYEFDPLKKKNLQDYCVNKSNELLLLEHLLTEEIYGTVEDTQSFASSEEESSGNSNEGACALMPPPTPTRVDSLQDSNFSETSSPVITNPCVKNAILEPIIESYLAKADDELNPLDVMMESQTNWFVNCEAIEKEHDISPYNTNKQDITKKVTKSISLPKIKNPTEEEPPTYAEAIGVTDSGKSLRDQLPFSETNEVKEQTAQAAVSLSSSAQTKMKSVFSNVITKMDVLKRKTSFRSNRSSKSDVKIILEMVPKPQITQFLIRYEGPLIRFPSGVVEDILNDMQNRKAVLRDKKFQAYQDQAMKNLKESFLLENITTVQCVSNNKITDNFTHLYCFEITVAVSKNQSSSQKEQSQVLLNSNMAVTNKDSNNCKLQRICHLYGVGKESERDIWMQKLIESLTHVFPSNYTCQYYRGGWCYLKRSITSPWSGAWIMLMKRKRRLLFHTDHEMNLEKVDLRKARCIVLKENDGTIKNLHVEPGPIIMLDCPPHTLYLIMNFSRETKIWRHIIREVAHNNGPSLCEQQITKYDVPVIVDKCINFIYIYGSMSEGIYRKSGSEQSIQKLIQLFRGDAFSVEITRPEYSEHDVANVLKRFMRDLPQKLLSKYSESFCSLTKIKSRSEKIASYKELLNRLNIVEHQTLKKLIGHLNFISSLNSKNKMNIENLAMIWGPTILQNKEEQMSYSQQEADVISDLIIHYKNLFVLSADEMKKEQNMMECLTKYYASGESLSGTVKQSGDLKVWITYNKDEKTQINIALTPTKTAYEVCKELSAKIKIPSHQLSLFEVVLNEQLERPLHHEEKVFDIVLSWTNWSEIDRKNNYLVVRKNDILKEIERALRNLPTVTPCKELKFADDKTKSLKLFNIELRDSKILIQKKDKTNSINIVKEISLLNSVAYIGSEKKRSNEIPPLNWSITFIQKKSTDSGIRTKEKPFIGHVISGTEWKDRIIWFSSIWHYLYGDNLLPQPELVIK